MSESIVRPSCLRFTVLVFFFFQAEDGIRDYKVTGVQTCALPISAAAAVSLAWLEGNESPLPHPSGYAMCTGSALQGRGRATWGFTTRALRRSAAPMAAQRRRAASAR